MARERTVRLATDRTTDKLPPGCQKTIIRDGCGNSKAQLPKSMQQRTQESSALHSLRSDKGLLFHTWCYTMTFTVR